MSPAATAADSKSQGGSGLSWGCRGPGGEALLGFVYLVLLAAALAWPAVGGDHCLVGTEPRALRFKGLPLAG